MPTYEYACRDCGEHLEVVQSFKDDPLSECPNCHGALRKVFSAAGIIFKGSGWHIKDYKSGSTAAASSDAKDASSSKDGTSPTAESGSSSATKDTGTSTSSDSTGSSSTSSTSTPATKSA